MSYRPDYFDAPPETDPAPARCPICRSAEDCDCGNDDNEAVAVASPSSLRVNGREESEVRVADPTTATLYADHRRRGSEG